VRRGRAVLRRGRRGARAPSGDRRHALILADPAVAYYGSASRVAPDRDLIHALVEEVARSGELILKRRVAALEDEVCRFVGCGHGVAVSSGTSAVQLALAALGVGPGDEVIVPAFGFHSSASCVARLRARPVLVDVEPDTWLIDPDAVAAAITPRTAAIVPVHVFAAMANMQRLRWLSREHGIALLENSAVALGMRRDGGPAGRWGEIGVFSFHPVKPLAGVSDGGMVVTDAGELATRVRMLRNHGQDGVHRFVHHLVGYNARMDELNAGVLLARLRRYGAARDRRAAIARRYDEAFGHLAPRVRLLPQVLDEPVHYTYVIACERRDELERRLAERGIETKVYYPEPLHLQRAFAFLGYRPGEFPNAERACRESLALPFYPEMPNTDVDAVIAAVLELQ
jgi:dTDP-4-amino-4,6-dideoxygalactose transaminase